MTKVADAARALMVLLPESDARIPATVAIESLRRQGFANSKTLERAREEAGVIAERVGYGRGGSWWWSRSPRVAVSRGKRRHVQSIRPRSWQLDDGAGDVAVSCDRCRRVGIAPIEMLPINCPTSDCSGIMRRPVVAMAEPISEPNVEIVEEIDRAVWPGTFHPCPVCRRTQAVRADGRCVYLPACPGVIRVTSARTPVSQE